MRTFYRIFSAYKHCDQVLAFGVTEVHLLLADVHLPGVLHDDLWRVPSHVTQGAECPRHDAVKAVNHRRCKFDRVRSANPWRAPCSVVLPAAGFFFAR